MEITTRYIVKKVIYENMPLVTYDDSKYSSDKEFYPEKVEVVSDIQIVGIYKSKQVAEEIVQKLQIIYDDVRIEEIAWEI